MSVISPRVRHVAKMSQIVYVVIAIASFYYPDPDVATSNGFQDALAQNVTIPAHLYKDLLEVLRIQGVTV